MKVHCESTIRKIALSDEPPENNCRPAVDVLFRSVAYSGISSTCAVVMTGMGKDGCLGLRLLKRGRTFAICQDAASCVVYGMPKEAIDAGLADRVVGVGDIAHAIIEAVRCKH